MSEAAPATAPRWHFALVGALFLLLAASYPYAMLVVDSGRDFAQAQAIAAGEAWPAYGPGLNATWRLGPAWFYLLALPFAAGATLGGVALAIGLLGAAKVPLAYALGRRLQDPALGLAAAALVALPGWSSFGQLVVLHTSVVESAVLATLLCALHAWRRSSARSACASALLLALALHAHPTALVAAPAVALAVWRSMRVHGARVVAGAALCGALPFLPMLWAEARAGWPQLQATLDYAAGADYGARLVRAPAVLRGATWGGVEFARDFLFSPWPAFARAYAAALALLGALAVAGAGLRLRQRSVAGVWVAAACAFGAVLLLRDTTPEWMTYALAPFGAFALAVGLLAPWPARSRAALALACAALALVSCGALLRDRQLVARAGWQALPGAAIADVAQPPRADATPRFWLTAGGQDALARALCETGEAVALHGDLATALHFGQGVALRRHCRGAEVRLGGSAARAMAGMPRALAEQLGAANAGTLEGFALAARTSALHPALGVPAAFHTRYVLDDYLPRLRNAERHAVSVRGHCRPRDLIVATNLLPLLNLPFALRDAGGGVPTPRARSIASDYYACPPDGRIDWTLEVLDPAAADVFVWHAD